MRLSLTLTVYCVRLFLLWFAAVLVVFAAVVLLFDTVELFRRSSSNPFATFNVVIVMSLVKLPNMIEKMLPFAVLVAAMLSLWRLNRHHELVVTRAIGVSVWQLVLPLAAGGCVVGLIELVAFNPFASALYARYQVMEAEYVGNRPALAALTGKTIWFRQQTADGHYFLHAEEIVPATGSLRTVMALLMGEGDRFIGRIDADRARLGVGYWVLYNATVQLTGAPPRRLAAYRLESDLTIAKIQESFADPATLSFWALPGFVHVLEAAGFPATRHKLHWQSLLALPVLLAAVVLVAATFSLRPMRRGGTRVVILTGMVCGFALFILMDVVSALGAASRIPIWLAAWSPIMIAMLLGSAMLFHLEDG